jgi:CubicO group peptidase (beta-lactamase class C family)
MMGDMTNIALDALLAPYDRDNAPGLCVGVLDNGVTTYQRGCGLADLSTRERIDTHTNFRLASVSKAFTAMACLRLIRAGSLAFDETVSDVFADFPDYGRTITIAQLLTHRSGLIDYEDLLAPDRLEQVDDVEVLTLLAAQTRTLFAPGERYAYSNSGYVLLGLMLAARSGVSFAECLRRQIFEPLGMRDTCMRAGPSTQITQRAFGYTAEKSSYMPTDQDMTSATQGDGGVYSSIADLARWHHALDSHALLDAELQSRMFTPVTSEPDSPDAVGYALGWRVDFVNGHKRIWHNGSSIGFSAHIARFPALGLAVTVLSNIDGFGAEPLARRIVACMRPELA